MKKEGEKEEKILQDCYQSWFDGMCANLMNDHLRVDKEQYNSIRHFLKYPLTLVNGYPGTGKTHLAREAVRLLLNSNYHKPIVVITQTNHSLDAFFEGVLSFAPPESILRHGGKLRTENEVLISRCYNGQMMSPFYKMTSFSDEKGRMKNLSRRITISNYILTKIFEISRLVVKYIFERKQFYLPKIQEGMEKYLLPLLSFDFREVYKLPFYPNTIEINEKSMPKDKDYIGYWINDNFDEQMEMLAENLKIPLVRYDENPYNARINHDDFVDKDRDQQGDPFRARILEEYIKIDNNFKLPEIRELQPMPEQKTKETSSDDDESSDDDLASIIEGDIDTTGLESENITEFDIYVLRDSQINNLIEEAIKKSQKLPEKRFEYMRDFFKHLLTVITNKRDAMVNQMDSVSQELDLQRNKAVGMLYSQFRVVGLTASYATMHRVAIERSGCEFMIIEEAGELTEATSASFLGASIKHLLMIGDFQQLRPKVEYEIREDKNTSFAYDISMFERLVRAEGKVNGKDLFKLTVQRRMHPEISQIIRENFCPDIIDAPNTNNNEICPGLQNRVNFILSKEFVETGLATSRSKINDNEANYVVALVFFFLCRGITPDKIVVITLYKGQAKLIKQKLKKEYETKRNTGGFDEFDPFLGTEYTINDIYVQCVDNYQGEENDVVIVATTRSETIGFVKAKNRALVTLSRAKNYLIVLGNEQLLKDEDSGIWPEIINRCESRCEESCLPGIFISCPHDQKILSTPELLWEYRFGNCFVKEKINLPCGHTIMKQCCAPILPCQQPCKHKCRKCGNECGHICSQCQKNGHPPCEKKTNYTCPNGHTTKVFCSQIEDDSGTSICEAPCGCTLPCGHKCTLPCKHNSQLTPHHCDAIVDYVCDVCLRSQKVPCGTKHCTLDCMDILPCGHKCQAKCGQPHVCNRNCEYVFPCGHQCKCKCSDSSYDHQHFVCKQCIAYEEPNSRFNCQVCGRMSMNRKPIESCEHRCNIKCKECDTTCNALAGERCIFCCQHDCGYQKGDGPFFRPNNCQCVMPLHEAEESIRSQFNSIMEPSQINPQQLFYLRCPKCKTPITSSWKFMKEIKIVYDLLKQANEIANIKLSNFFGYEQVHHNIKVVHCRCSCINFFDISPVGNEIETEQIVRKCERCHAPYIFTKGEKKEPEKKTKEIRLQNSNQPERGEPSKAKQNETPKAKQNEPPKQVEPPKAPEPLKQEINEENESDNDGKQQPNQGKKSTRKRPWKSERKKNKQANQNSDNPSQQSGQRNQNQNQRKNRNDRNQNQAGSDSNASQQSQSFVVQDQQPNDPRRQQNQKPQKPQGPHVQNGSQKNKFKPYKPQPQ
ncbi:hypothetical protein TVAG_113750 [Trichomonas vaginalis G3]|uniref:DNA2/NAM7 helicase-like C-terminal domain-containing protein n=1 Tax=Trichomonas vaginalis (strain ATCC PRA-98 / G3) TaxID=412133 RepID=A2DNM8_TRIV3|nr:Nfx1-type zinc finger-containing protein family [Trichomonas vaginalis G3]EAY18031.1 hypothetical protein TVAG_113750 [Trichomonas vaginalis G3]KAI5524411.1 Nfx1-type zinc finger-containing protein family [Trichomonas vaginalis G3]|eukprot:XP_001579017.1 hypothetical protein [Trichomonas vaginalis G3]